VSAAEFLAAVQSEVHVSADKNKSLRMLALAAGSFTAFAIGIMALAAKGVVTFQLGLLMLIGLVGLYFGFGVLIVVYRFIAKLD
jgi:formate/nitrite transporter FocA (FNT family)